MSHKALLITMTILIAIGLALAFSGDAAAQADDQVTGDTKELKSTDKDLAQKKTVDDSLSNRKLGGDEAEGPTRFQMGLGVGSCFVMIAVVKWL